MGAFRCGCRFNLQHTREKRSPRLMAMGTGKAVVRCLALVFVVGVVAVVYVSGGIGHTPILLSECDCPKETTATATTTTPPATTKATTEPAPKCEEDGKSPMVIKIMTYTRPKSLARLLKALDAAHYPEGTNVHVDIYVDHTGIDGGAAKANEYAQRAAAIAAADAWQWAHGTKRVVLRGRNQGLSLSWLNLWAEPRPNEEMAVILEDDCDLSPFWYEWVMKAFEAYGNHGKGAANVVALTMQKQGLLPAEGVKKASFPMPTEGAPYLSPLPGSWGFVALRDPWQAFLRWQAEQTVNPKIPGLVTSNWFNEKHTWTIWYIKWVNLALGRRMNVYANMPGKTTLLAGWRDKGVHSGRDDGQPHPPVLERVPELEKFPPVKELKCFGWDGKPLACDRSGWK